MRILKVPSYKIIQEGEECIVERDELLVESAHTITPSDEAVDEELEEAYVWLQLNGLDPGLANVYRSEKYGDDIVIDYDGDVNLANRNLRTLSYRFGIVRGNFNVIDNRLTTFDYFPDMVTGNCMFGFNRIPNYSSCHTICDGKMLGVVQRCLTDYPLNQVNYEYHMKERMEPRAVINEKYTGVILKEKGRLLEIRTDHDNKVGVYDIKDVRRV